jgi:hypothetical protein
MTESILDTIKLSIGIEPDDTDFDVEITMHINTAFFTLNQLGVGPTKAYSIKDSENTWAEFIGDRLDLEAVKTYVYLKVKLLFETSSMSSGVIAAYNNQIDELGWRLKEQAEHPEE